MDNKEIKLLANILGIDEEYAKVKEYIGSLDDAKFIEIYEKLKSRLGIEQTIKYLNLIVNMTKYNISRELAKELLLDEELQDLVISGKLDNNKFVNRLSSEINEELDDTEKHEQISSIDDDDFPVYTVEEEKMAFSKYTKLRKELEDYINLCYPEFVTYIMSKRTETKDPFITRALEKLYSYTCTEEEVVRIKKDTFVSKKVEELREVRDDIAYHNFRLANSIAKRYIDLGVPKADLQQEGKMGLSKAIEKFNSTKGFKFSTYASWWIEQHITRSVANDSSVIRVPVHQHEKLLKIRRAEKFLRTQDGIDNPTDMEIFEKCKELGYDFTLDQIKEKRKIESIKNPTSTDRYVGEDEDTSLIDFISSDDYEKPEALAESNDINERVNKILDDLTKDKEKSKSKPPIIFKELTFIKTNGEEISIILTSNEYQELKTKLNSSNKKAVFVEFLNKYKIDPTTLTSALNVKNVVMTSKEREVLVFRYRMGLANEFSDSFLAKRNYNGVLFDESYSNEEELTLEKAGKLFGVTRERIRQIESKIRRRIEASTGKKAIKSTVNRSLYMGQSLNIYEIFSITNTIDYIPVVKPNRIINIDSNGNIVPLGEGMVTVYLKHIKSSTIRELNITVIPNLKVSINDFIRRTKELKLSIQEYKKDNQ